MKQRCVIYTTTSGNALTERLPFIMEQLNKTPGRTVEMIDVVSITPPEPMTIKDSDGDVRIVWDWFERTFTEKSEGYNVVCFHFTPYYKNKWGLSPRVVGTYRNDPNDTFEFWVAANPTQDARYYDFDEFTRIFLHEWAHGDSHFAGVPEEWKPVDYVHHYDYELHAIHTIPFDYTKHNVQLKLVEVLTTLVTLYKKLWTRSK